VEGGGGQKEEREGEEGMEEDDEEEGGGEGDEEQNDNQGGDGGDEDQGGDWGEGEGGEGGDDEDYNPIGNPGDANEFWFKRLDIVGADNDTLEEEMGTEDNKPNNENPNVAGKFEYSNQGGDGSTQVLGAKPEGMKDDEEEEDEGAGGVEMDREENEGKDTSEENKREKKKERRQGGEKKELTQKSDSEKDVVKEEDNEGEDEEEKMDIENPIDDVVGEDDGEDDQMIEDLESERRTDIDQLTLRDEEGGAIDPSMNIDDGINVAAKLACVDGAVDWDGVYSTSLTLSRRLCEKLRLVLTPLLATKLTGNYRAGKRINMKAVIPYIASGFRRDKIWLRRTKPAKRDYKIMVAIDDSSSMKKGGGHEMAITTLCVLASALNQLEAGKVCIARFGEEVEVVKSFEESWSLTKGREVNSRFEFQQERTRTKECVEGCLSELRGGGDGRKLCFLISDGRIERDNRADLRRLVREMTEANILLVCIIVDPLSTGEEGIERTKEVTFVKGKPKVKGFLDDFPFPFYAVVRDVKRLPEVLGEGVKEWFEIIGRMER